MTALKIMTKNGITDINVDDANFITDDERIADRKQLALEEIKKYHAEKITEKSGKATTEERDTWPIKLNAAIDVISGDYGNAAATLADESLPASAKIKARIIIARHKTLVVVGNETKEQLAEKVIQKFEYLCAIIEAAEFLKRSVEKQTVDIKVTVEELYLIDQVLDVAKQQAEQVSNEL